MARGISQFLFTNLYFLYRFFACLAVVFCSSLFHRFHGRTNTPSNCTLLTVSTAISQQVSCETPFVFWLKKLTEMGNAMAIHPRGGLLPYKGDFYLWKYVPSMPAAVIFAIVFLVLSLAHTWKMIRSRLWFCLAFAIGGYRQSYPLIS